MTDRMVRKDDLYSAPHWDYKKSYPQTTINIVSIVCGHKGGHHVGAFLQSLIDNPSALRINVTIFADEEIYARFSACVKAIKSPLVNLMHIEAANAQADPGGAVNSFWNGEYKCAANKLNMINLLPSIDRVLFLDIDVLVMEDLHNIWKQWSEIPSKVFHLAPEVQPPLKWGWYARNHRYKGMYYPPNGLNSGVILMDLKEMRRLGLNGSHLLNSCDGPVLMGDQDIFNNWAFHNQGLVGILDCRWNRRWDSFCRGANQDDFGDLKPRGIIHGSRQMFHHEKYTSEFPVIRQFHRNLTHRFVSSFCSKNSKSIQLPSE